MEALRDLATSILRTAGAGEKAKATLSGEVGGAGGAGGTAREATVPDRPARPAWPELLAPKDMPRRRAGRSAEHRIALLHALAHIELNAIDLAWDMVARFTDDELPDAFFEDWAQVAREEAKHFLLLQARLADFGAGYGDLPAHDGLWQAAYDTRHDLVARLAVVPLVLEARGLDVTPPMIARMRDYGDTRTAEILEIIYRDEIGHVAIGKRWFDRACADRGLDPVQTWQRMVARFFKGQIKPPFNEDARAAAGFPAADYAAAFGATTRG